MKNKTIKILGAGISGLVAGIVLSKHGYQVEIFEKRPHVGSFFEKSIHSFRNYLYNYDVIERYQELGIDTPKAYPVYKEFRFSPSLKKVEIYSKNKPLFYNFFRGYKKKESLDVKLYETAKKNGVKIYFDQNKNSDEMDIIASGACSPKVMGYGGYYSGVSNIDSRANYVFLDNRYSPHVYSYILPFKDEVAIVFGSTKKENKNELKKRFNHFKKNNPIVNKIINNSKFENEIFGYCYYNFPESAIKNGKLYTGEAGGLADAATVFGTHYAILSGYFAAISIVENKNYDSLWKKSFRKELKIQYLKREKIQKFTNQDYENIIGGLMRKYGNIISFNKYRVQHNYSRSLKK